MSAVTFGTASGQRWSVHAEPVPRYRQASPCRQSLLLTACDGWTSQHRKV